MYSFAIVRKMHVHKKASLFVVPVQNGVKTGTAARTGTLRGAASYATIWPPGSAGILGLRVPPKTAVGGGGGWQVWKV